MDERKKSSRVFKVEAVRLLTARGAASVSVMVTHALFVDEAFERLKAAGVTDITSTDSVCHHSNAICLAETLAAELQLGGVPDPDLLIRTGGEQRISNFLLWNLAYAELYFCDTLWPDFTREEFLQSIIAYQRRERRFGKVKNS